MPGTLYLVATPIGNLGDITVRALEVLKQVAFIVCEDTRHSRILFDHYGIRKDTVSLPAFAEGARAEGILRRLKAGESCALVTDAGTPAISDPGEILVALAVAEGVSVVPIPGPSAAVTALSASGLHTGRFVFLGFLPRKGGDRDRTLEAFAATRATRIIYESPRRLPETLEDLLAAWGDRPACVARELTKMHEEFVRGTLSELVTRYRGTEVLGEVVLLVDGAALEGRWELEKVRGALEAGLQRGERLKVLSKELAQPSGWAAGDVYKLGLELKGG